RHGLVSCRPVGLQSFCLVADSVEQAAWIGSARVPAAFMIAADHGIRTRIAEPFSPLDRMTLPLKRGIDLVFEAGIERCREYAELREVIVWLAHPGMREARLFHRSLRIHAEVDQIDDDLRLRLLDGLATWRADARPEAVLVVKDHHWRQAPCLAAVRSDHARMLRIVVCIGIGIVDDHARLAGSDA